MLGVDTNVLVRFITRDAHEESPQALDLIRAGGNQPIRVCMVALVEFVWVLTKVKKLPWADVVETCRDLLANAAFEFERADLVRRALDEASAARCDLADAVIALANKEAGCDSTATFDHDAQRLTAMVSVESRL